MVQSWHHAPVMGRDTPPVVHLEAATAAPRFRALAGVSRNVYFLGLTSLLTDTSSEMVSSVLPLYLTFALNFAPWQYGIFDGLFQGLAGVLRLWGGLTADRHHRHKHVAAAGYAGSAACKAGLFVVGPAWF